MPLVTDGSSVQSMIISACATTKVHHKHTNTCAHWGCVFIWVYQNSKQHINRITTCTTCAQVWDWCNFTQADCSHSRCSMYKESMLIMSWSEMHTAAQCCWCTHVYMSMIITAYLQDFSALYMTKQHHGLMKLQLVIYNTTRHLQYFDFTHTYFQM